MLKCALPCFKENKRVQKQDHVVVLCVTGFFPHVLLPHFEIDTPTSPFYNCGSLLLRMMKHCSQCILGLVADTFHLQLYH